MDIPNADNRDRPRGDEPLEQVVEQHWDAVYRLLYHLSGNRHDAEDLAQETFLRAINRQDSFRAGTNRRAWLLRIASNAFFDVQRKRKTAKAVPLGEDLPQAAAPPAGPAETAELGVLLAAALAHLSQVQRAVFLLRSVEALSFREIADILDLREETARWHMMHARRQLLERLEGRI